MKPNELRIGNWVERDTDYKSLGKEVIQINNISGEISNVARLEIDRYSGIPLTPEWLEKFGFDNCVQNTDGERYYYKQLLYGQLIINTEDNMWFLADSYKSFCTDDYWVDDQYVKYVHQLQNLYFALTGNELEIKELNENG